MDRPIDELEESARTIAQGELDTIREYIDYLELENENLGLKLGRATNYHTYCKQMLDEIQATLNKG